MKTEHYVDLKDAYQREIKEKIAKKLEIMQTGRRAPPDKKVFDI